MSTLIIRRTIHMKTAIKITAVALVAIMLVCAFASCAKTLSGSYSGKALLGTYTYEFKGNKVTRAYKVGNTTTTSEGTYEIAKDENGNQVIKFTTTDGDGKSTTTSSKFSEGSVDGKAFIEIDGVRYTKD